MLRVPSPSSRGAVLPRLSLFDVVWASASPLLALYCRDADIYLHSASATIGYYWAACLGCSLIAFIIFRIGDGVTIYFSVHDVLVVLKAVILAELMTSALLFSLTRLEGIPRSVPVIHALFLVSGLVTARMFVRVLENKRYRANHGSLFDQHIIMIGSNKLSSLYIKMVEAFGHGRRRVVAVLDDRQHMVGRTVEGVRVVGAPEDLEVIVDEFAVHGIRVDRVIVGGETNLLSNETLDQVQEVCGRSGIELNFVPRLIGLGEPQAPVGIDFTSDDSITIVPPTYFRAKRFIDFCAALTLLILLLPLFAGVSLLVLLDVGSPVFFWQQRLGQRRRSFLIYKFRTLRPPFDWRGRRVPENQRLSWIGQLLRETSLDELPQLLNVLAGDMSLIGPRPLLPEDQPSNPTVRLFVRPGITGWAQVNGAKLLTPEEKDDLDEWYIRNASLWLDLRILVLTVEFALRGPRRPEGLGTDVGEESTEWKELATVKRELRRL